MAITTVAGEINNPVPSPEQSKIKGHLYRIEKSGGGLIGFLFGTFHRMHPMVKPLNEKIDEAIVQCDRLYLEVAEVDLVKQTEMDQIRQSISEFTDSEIEEANSNYRKICSSNDFLEEVDRLEPKERLFRFVLEYRRMKANIQGIANGKGEEITSLDEFIFYRFQEKQKPVFGLETFEEHHSLGERYMLKKSKNQVELDPSPIEELPKQTEVLAERWCEGRIPNPSILAAVSDPQDEPAYALGAARSRKMGLKILQELDSANKEKPSFFAFGVIHLYDGEGILELLSNKGYIVSRV